MSPATPAPTTTTHSPAVTNLTLTAGLRRWGVLGEGVLQGWQEAAHVRVALSATEVGGKLVEQCRAARRADDIKAVGGDLADLAGCLQVSVRAVAQGQPGSLEQGSALAWVAARDVVRPDLSISVPWARKRRLFFPLSAFC
ncbi:hypothetical protein Srubr_61390 [Streptomyces rubradiris]|uniref:Uncharacterized protein n=1 Tax=Streptomyces rubradiris TaxID=285531 RepID=A0ABQ3RK94_STRRR|nr:hypothetical protein Srubr_61390 [Streptomyces rubradiris]